MLPTSSATSFRTCLLYTSKDSYDVFVDLPGFKKEDIKLDLENGYLTISA